MPATPRATEYVDLVVGVNVDGDGNADVSGGVRARRSVAGDGEG